MFSTSKCWKCWKADFYSKSEKCKILSNELEKNYNHKILGWILRIFWIWIKNNSTKRLSSFQPFQQKTVEKSVEIKNNGWNHIKSQHFCVKTVKAKVLNWFFNEKLSKTRLKVLKTRLKVRKTFSENLNFKAFLLVERLSTAMVWSIELTEK